MSLNRFKLLRRCLCFNATPTNLDQDAAARIRPLLNLLKVTGDKYVVVGRDVALDEASVACRSRQGRHMIVFNPTKPTGKYHFRLYMVCCSSTWIALRYKLHCNRNNIADRLKGVIAAAEVQALSQELEEVSKIRQHVLEVVQPMFGSNRVVSLDDYYASVQLPQGLRLKGLYARGTIRMNSKHFPGHTMLDKDDKCVRGEMRQAVSREHGMVAASWCDGNIVHMVTNADASSVSAVTRTVAKGGPRVPSAYMCQGVQSQHARGGQIGPDERKIFYCRRPQLQEVA
ncbi:unnamed protein product [Phytophthora fragariaefolia]|uniref:Unnamed protein product n=1 Tax=Phytophthora fragariaefolia TaxID=1490495 RepID=A0A9W7CTF7_9STRA|nr:unnamed protein product [Phytophthora fragariaefolia]